jgi:hypothetical protein
MIVTVGPLASAVANNICTSQTPTAALTLNGALVTGGVAYLDTPRRILITVGASEAGKTFAVVGTNWAGDRITESIAGPASGTVASVLDYKTVTSITISSTAAAALTVGTTTTAASPWVRFDDWALPQASVGCVISGTVNYTVQQTMDDPNDPNSPVAVASMTWTSALDTTLVGASSNILGVMNVVPRWGRILLNSGTGSVTGTFRQLGVVPF